MKYSTMIGTSMLLLAALAGVLVWGGWRHIFRPPPFQFSEEVYLPTRPNVCPGDQLEWQSKLIVNRTPSVLAVARTLWDASRQKTLRPDEQLDFFVWNHSEHGETLSRTNTFQVPRELRVGLYELRTGATAFNSDATSYRVPFVIAQSCFKKGKS